VLLSLQHTVGSFLLCMLRTAPEVSARSGKWQPSPKRCLPSSCSLFATCGKECQTRRAKREGTAQWRRGRYQGITQRHHYIDTSRLCVRPHMGGLQVRPGVGTAHAAQHAGRLSQDAPDHVDHLLLCRHHVDRRSNHECIQVVPLPRRGSVAPRRLYRVQDRLCQPANQQHRGGSFCTREQAACCAAAESPPCQANQARGAYTCSAAFALRVSGPTCDALGAGAAAGIGTPHHGAESGSHRLHPRPARELPRHRRPGAGACRTTLQGGSGAGRAG
jgi:hypothetical protein